jgi:hypothetical protein
VLQSASGTSGAPATLRRLFLSPPLDFRLQPELDATIPEIQDWPRHVGVPVLIDADRVAVGESENLGHAVRIEKVVEVYAPAHATQITFVKGSVRGDI